MSTVRKTVRELLHERGQFMTPSDQKVARALLANYPVSGLATVAELSDAAGVSAPSVVRFVKRLGLSGHAEFQQRIQAEIEGSLTGRADGRPRRSATLHLPDYAAYYLRAVERELDESLERLQSAELAGAIKLLADHGLRILLLSDAATAHVATAFHRRLFALRPNCQALDPDPLTRSDALMGISKNDVIVAFDRSPGAEATAAFCRLAVERGAQLVVFGSAAHSPLAALARYVFVATGETPSMLPTACLTEIVLLGTQRAIGQPATDRLRHLEAEGVISYAFDVNA